MLTLTRTNSQNQDFIKLVKALDAYLVEKDGDDHDFYNQYNNIDVLNHVVVAYQNGLAVGCGAIKEYHPDSMEVKRMYTDPNQRCKGVASQVLTELEKWATEKGCVRCVLETGRRQTEAVHFYPSQGYKQIPNYGQYQGVENSVCFEKQLG